MMLGAAPRSVPASLHPSHPLQPLHVHTSQSTKMSKQTTNQRKNKLNALAWALQKNHFYITGAQTQIECFTDHKSLVNIENKDLAEVTNNRELKLLESITPYNIKVKHIPADKNTFADALSRLPSKIDTTPPPYIERYTPIQVKPHPKPAKIRDIRASGVYIFRENHFFPPPLCGAIFFPHCT